MVYVVVAEVGWEQENMNLVKDTPLSLGSHRDQRLGKLLSCHPQHYWNKEGLED